MNFDDPTWAQKVNSVEMRSSKRFTTRRSRDGATSLAAPVSLSRTHGIPNLFPMKVMHTEMETQKNIRQEKTLMARFGRIERRRRRCRKKRNNFSRQNKKVLFPHTSVSNGQVSHFSLFFTSPSLFLSLLLWDAESVAFYSMPTGHEWADGLLLDDAAYDGVRDDHRWVRGLGMLTDSQYGSDQFISDQRRSTFLFF